MSSLPHSMPSRTAHAIAALYGHEDDTLLAWQRFCAQAAEALRAHHDPERLTKALRLAQDGHVALEADGYALVTSGSAARCAQPASTQHPRQRSPPGQAAQLCSVGRARSPGVVVLQDPRGRLRVDAHHARHG